MNIVPTGPRRQTIDWRLVWAVVKKDLTVVTRSRAVMIPLIVLPIMLAVAMPMAMTASLLAAGDSMSAGSNMQDLEAFIRNMPAGIRAETASLNPSQLALVLMLVYFFAPLYLILPMMTASVIAADSFAGEKERKTLEALLYTPTTDRELFLAKCLGSFLPALAVGIGSFLVYSVVVNLAGWPIMGRIFFPNVTWLLLAFFVGPAAAGLGLVAMVFVSSRVSGFQDAYQLGSLVVLPVVMLMLGQTFGVVFLSVEFAVMLGVVLSLIDLALLYFGARVFSRSEIISRL